MHLIPNVFSFSWSKSFRAMREFCFVFVGRFAFQHGAVALFVYLGFLSSVCQASDLGSTKITAVRSTVEHFDGTAKGAGDVGQSVTPGHSVSTKEQSLAELTADDKSIIRLGANSVFSYSSAERIVKLDKGTMLMHTPPGNGGATIDSGGVVGAISGTTFMLTASPAKCSDCGQELRVSDTGKVICRDHPNNPPASGGFALVVLEGSSVTKVTGPDGQTVAVAPGQMAVVGPKGSGAPAVYAVNLTQIARTSPLINAFPTPLPSMPQIMATAYQLQNQNLQTTGTSGVAISSSGQLLTAVSPPPNPFLQTFSLASNQPGQNNSSNPSNLANISTAAGGGGGGGSSAPTGVAPTGGGPSTGPTIPPSPSTPPNQSQNAVAANQPTPVTASANVASKVYDGTPSAALSGAVFTTPATGISLVNDTVGAFVSPNVGAAVPVNTFMSITGPDVALYNFTTPILVGQITARPIQLLNPLVTSIEYNGSTSFSSTRLLGSFDLNNIVGAEQLNVTGNGTITGTADVGMNKFAGMTYTLGNGANGGLAGNYLPLADDNIILDITEKMLSYASPTAASKMYDGSAGATVTLGNVQGLVGSETLVIGETSFFNNKNVGTGKSVSVNFSLADGSNGGKASNYRLNNLSLSANINAKPVNVDMTAAVISKAYNGNASVTVAGADLGRIAVGSGNDTDGLAYTGDTVSLSANLSVTLQRALPGTLIPVIGTGFSLTGADAGNYSLRQPTGLTGEITGSASLNRDGVALNLSSAQYLHLRNTTANRMQDGLNISTTTGQILIENSTFDGWMKRDNTARVINSATGTTISFSESANVAVNSPVLRVQMEANTAAGAPGYMLLGDYQLRLQRDPDSNPTTANSVGATLFTFPGVATDPNAIGSLAPSADLVLRDSASTELRNVAYDAPEYSSILNGSGQAVTTGNFAPVEGEFNPDGSVRMSDLDVATASGTWNVTLDQPIISGEGKVTDVRLKYNNNTRALIESPDGVRLLNVVFEGMDQVDVRTAANLDNRVLMSGTLVSDPNISKMIVQVGQKLEAHFNSDITLAEVSRQGSVGAPGSADAAIMAGVREKVGGGLEFIPGSPDRVLEMQRATVAGQLSLASATVVFNNANISSGGVILVSTRNGVVNRTYGSVVPGAVSFIGGSGNFFQNTANGQSMNIANSGHIGTAFTSGKLSESGAGTGTVMSVGRVQ